MREKTAVINPESKGKEFCANVQELLAQGGSDPPLILAGEETLALAAHSKAAFEKFESAYATELQAPPTPPQPHRNRAQRKLDAQHKFRQEQLAKATQARQAAQARAREARDVAARAEGLASEAERRSINAARREAERVAAEAAVIAAQQAAREATEAAQLEAAEAIVAASAAQECLVLVTQAVERAQHAAEIATGIARRCV